MLRDKPKARKLEPFRTPFLLNFEPITLEFSSASTITNNSSLFHCMTCLPYTLIQNCFRNLKSNAPSRM